MDDMTVIHNFFYSLENEDVVAKWGLKSDAEGCMKLLALCTHPTSKKDV